MSRARPASTCRRTSGAPGPGAPSELGYHPGDQPNYYNLVFTAVRPHQVAGKLTALGLPPDSTRYGYRPLHQQPIFTRYATPGCPNAEALATSTFQLPVHPGLSEAAIELMTAHLAAIAREETA